MGENLQRSSAILDKVRALPIDPERTPPDTVLTREGALASNHPVVDQLLDVLRTARVAGAGVAEVREPLRLRVGQ